MKIIVDRTKEINRADAMADALQEVPITTILNVLDQWPSQRGDEDLEGIIYCLVNGDVKRAANIIKQI